VSRQVIHLGPAHADGRLGGSQLQALSFVSLGATAARAGQRRIVKRSRAVRRNGAVVGAVIGAVALGAFAGTLCHAYREKGGASCTPDAIRFAAIGGAIGLGAGTAIDVARSSSPMARLSIAF
jgi:hypothetical protein